jgi:hypothetical protein
MWLSTDPPLSASASPPPSPSFPSDPRTLVQLLLRVRTLPTPLLLLASLVLGLLSLGLIRRARHAVLGPSAQNPYRHMRHRHRANANWRPAPNDIVRQLLFFATGRRVTTDFLAPLTSWLVAAFAVVALLPSPILLALHNLLTRLKNDPLTYVVLLCASKVFDDTIRNVVAGLELTTTHVRFDKNDRVRFHVGGGDRMPEGIVRHITSREVVIKCVNGGHCFLPAALAVTLAVTVFDEDSGDEGATAGGDLSPSPAVPAHHHANVKRE